MYESVLFFVVTALRSLMFIMPVVVSVAILIYLERKLLAMPQLRVGPNVVGPFGVLQSFADAFKIMFKETIIPSGSSSFVFLIAPVITFGLAMAAWAVVPIGPNLYFANVNLGAIYLLAISALGVYGLFLAGWASNSKYAFFGAIRSASQMISYEIAIGLSVMTVAAIVGSFNLIEIVNFQKDHWLCIPLFPLFIIFFTSILAETNRHPFDLPEAESELVAGYGVEYSSLSFAMFFLGEYANMILMSSFCVILFMGGWLPPFDIDLLAKVPPFIWFIAKVLFVLYFFIVARVLLPRYRYDQLMRIGWKFFLPINLLIFLVVTIIVFIA